MSIINFAARTLADIINFTERTYRAFRSWLWLHSLSEAERTAYEARQAQAQDGIRQASERARLAAQQQRLVAAAPWN